MSPARVRPSRHPKHDEIVRLLREGLSNAEVVRRLRCDKNRVAQIRAEESIPGPHDPRSLIQKWRERAVEGEDGHMSWTGKHNNGTPVVRHDGHDHSARAIAFTMRTKRAPEGNTLPDCGWFPCVAPAHMQDSRERTEIREQVRFLRGLPVRNGTCKRGHDQTVYGRYDAAGTSYCASCGVTKRAACTARKRAARLEGE